MSVFGYDTAELEKGKALLATANARYDENRQDLGIPVFAGLPTDAKLAELEISQG